MCIISLNISALNYASYIPFPYKNAFIYITNANIIKEGVLYIQNIEAYYAISSPPSSSLKYFIKSLEKNYKINIGMKTKI